MRHDVHTPADLGQAVPRARLASGLSQEALAAAAVAGPRFIVELEVSKTIVQLDKVLAVLGVLRLGLVVSDEADPISQGRQSNQGG